MKIIFVWAEDENHLIGKDNQLPWHLSADLKYFKTVTMNQTIVMGRKTFEGMGKRLLPGRKTVILTRDKIYEVSGAVVCHSIEETFNLNEDLYVIGGREIFKAYFPYVTDLYKTAIFSTFEGDTYFPEWKEEDFLLVSKEVFTDSKTQISGAFEKYEKSKFEENHEKKSYD